MMFGGGLALNSWQHPAAPAGGVSNDEALTRAYERVHTGMPVSQLSKIGLDTAKAQRLSKLALMENFMPKDSAAFDALDPAVQGCYLGPDCNAYIFTATGTQALLLVESGKVAWKTISDMVVADSRTKRALA